ncbi:MAG: hypothetical protein JSW23_06240 [Planctomycetota bacterium]|nr:MAG: hypothetical protein JSW23_06240 [Planctomycetota bacterium]
MEVKEWIVDGESCFVEGFGEIRGLKRNAGNNFNTLRVEGMRRMEDSVQGRLDFGRVVVFGVVVVCAFSSASLGAPWVGSGDANDPYQIRTAEDMQAIGADANYWDSYFKLMADIDLSEYTGTSFNIIGTGINALAFTGIFDGDGHVISNFTCATAGRNYVGLFGYIGVHGNNGEIREVGLTNVNVDGGSGNYVGSLVGYLRSGEVSDCWIEGGTVLGDGYGVGGLVGWNAYAEVSRSYSTVTVEGSDDSVGGLVGYNGNIVSQSFASGIVTGDEYVGGLVGRNYGKVSDCYSSSSVSGNEIVGGLVGYNWPGIVSRCYSTGSVSGNVGAGGLIGQTYEGAVYGSYWDINTSGQRDSGGGYGRTTTDMQDANNYIGWGCDELWKIDDGVGYPHLWWESMPGAPIATGLSDYLDGMGTEGKPYLVYTAEELSTLGLVPCDLDKYFRLMEDIDLSGYTGDSFTIIGYDFDNAFRGVFDGNGHQISGFTYKSTRIRYIGLFGALVGANVQIKNLGLVDPNVEGGSGDNVGALAGYLSKGSIRDSFVQGGRVRGRNNVGGLVGIVNSAVLFNCSSTGNVGGYNSVGGLAGQNLYYSVISQCHSTCTVMGDYPGWSSFDNMGGLVGYNRGEILGCYSSGTVGGADAVGGLAAYSSGSVSECYSTSDVEGKYNVAGLVANNIGNISSCYCSGDVVGYSNVGGLVAWSAGPITDSYAIGSVLATGWRIGGLVGHNSDEVRNCYAGGDVTGGKKVGGLIGAHWGEVFDCYSHGVVTGANDVGGLVGFDIGGTVKSSFWDVNTSGQFSSNGGIGLPTVEMQTESTFTDAGWDFVGEVINGTEDIWQMCALPDYPKLWWQACPVELEMNFVPAMLNCQSKGRWVKAHIVLPEGYLPEDVDVNSPMGAEPVGVESEWIEVVDEGDGNYGIVAAFDRAGFCGALGGDAEKELAVTVEGVFTDGVEFYGTDTIKLKSDKWRHRRVKRLR